MTKIIALLKKLNFTQILLLLNTFLLLLVLSELVFHPFRDLLYPPYEQVETAPSSTPYIAPKAIPKASGDYSEATQCLGTTLKGLRCKNKTKNPSGYCYHHDN